jgi:hypothetical protein
LLQSSKFSNGVAEVNAAAAVMALRGQIQSKH